MLCFTTLGLIRLVPVRSSGVIGTGVRSSESSSANRLDSTLLDLPHVKVVQPLDGFVEDGISGTKTVKDKTLYSEVSSPLDRSKCFTLRPPGRPVSFRHQLGFFESINPIHSPLVLSYFDILHLRHLLRNINTAIMSHYICLER